MKAQLFKNRLKFVINNVHKDRISYISIIDIFALKPFGIVIIKALLTSLKVSLNTQLSINSFCCLFNINRIALVQCI